MLPYKQRGSAYFFLTQYFVTPLSVGARLRAARLVSTPTSSEVACTWRFGRQPETAPHSSSFPSMPGVRLLGKAGKNNTVYLLQYFKHKDAPRYDYFPWGCEHRKHGVIYSYVKTAMHELLRWPRIERQQQAAGRVAAGIEV